MLWRETDGVEKQRKEMDGAREKAVTVYVRMQPEWLCIGENNVRFWPNLVVDRSCNAGG